MRRICLTPKRNCDYDSYSNRPSRPRSQSAPAVSPINRNCSVQIDSEAPVSNNNAMIVGGSDPTLTARPAMLRAGARTLVPRALPQKKSEDSAEHGARCQISRPHFFTIAPWLRVGKVGGALVAIACAGIAFGFCMISLGPQIGTAVSLGLLGAIISLLSAAKLREQDKVKEAALKMSPSAREVLSAVPSLSELPEGLQQYSKSLKDPSRLRKMLGNMKGFSMHLLVFGPTGTGKSEAIKRVCIDANCGFEVVSGADLVSKWVGETQKEVRKIFQQACDRALTEKRSQMILIDEIDCILKPRGVSDLHEHPHDSSFLGQFLTELDRINNSQARVYLAGTCNRIDAMDKALVRRFGTRVSMGVPNRDARRRVWERWQKESENAVKSPFEIVQLIDQTDGFNYGDIKSVQMGAAMQACADNRSTVTQTDLESALKQMRQSMNASGFETGGNIVGICH